MHVRRRRQCVARNGLVLLLPRAGLGLFQRMVVSLSVHQAVGLFFLTSDVQKLPEVALNITHP